MAWIDFWMSFYSRDSSIWNDKCYHKIPVDTVATIQSHGQRGYSTLKKNKRLGLENGGKTDAKQGSSDFRSHHFEVAVFVFLVQQGCP